MASGQTTVPAPYIVAPTYRWDGDDGAFSTFQITVGTPPQSFRVLPATVGEEIWLPITLGCDGPLLDLVDCGDLRGVNEFRGLPSRGFMYNESSTWDLIADDPYVLSTEQNLFGDTDTGIYGLDNATLGAIARNDAQVSNVVIAGISTADFLLGTMGLGISPGKFVGVPSAPSMLVQMANRSLVPSLSYGYTAGQAYASPKLSGSLVLGGYDESRIASSPEPVIVPINSSATPQVLQLGIQSILASDLPGGSSQQLLPGAITANVDSSVSQMWLPVEICNLFEDAFGLEYHPDVNYYLLNSTMHAQLQRTNPSLTFSVGTPSGSASMAIIVPYNALDLNLTLPLVNGSTPYFPLRQAADESQYTLGRVFLQEAYVAVDWERGNFTIGQAVAQNSTSSIVAIRSPVQTASSPPVPLPKHHAPSGLATGAVAGIVIAIIGILATAAGLGLFFWRRKRRARQTAPSHIEAALPEVGIGSMEEHYPADIKDEKLPFVRVSEVPSYGELHDEDRKPVELDNTQVHEMEEAIRNRELMSTPVFELPGHTAGSELDVSGNKAGHEPTTSDETSASRCT